MTAPLTNNPTLDGQLLGIRRLAARVRATMDRLDTAANSHGVVFGLDIAQGLALAAVELANYCSIHDKEIRRLTQEGEARDH